MVPTLESIVGYNCIHLVATSQRESRRAMEPLIDYSTGAARVAE